MQKPKELLGDHWKNTSYSELYQLYRRVEYIADELRKRQRSGHAPLVEHVRELDAISYELKSLDKRSVTRPRYSSTGVKANLVNLDTSAAIGRSETRVSDSAMRQPAEKSCGQVTNSHIGLVEGK